MDKSKIRLGAAVVIFLMALLAVPRVSADEGSVDKHMPSVATPVVKKLTLWNLVLSGGWAMWPLGFCSFMLVTSIVINARHVSRRAIVPTVLLRQAHALAREGEVGSLDKLLEMGSSLFSTALAAGLRRAEHTHSPLPRGRVEESAMEAIERYSANAEFRINFLSLISAAAPMLGLLGTVSGMIGAFHKIGTGGMGRPEQLAGNIGEALITTAAGLVLAVTAMFAFFMFRNYLNRLLAECEEETKDIIERIAEGNSLCHHINAEQ